MVLAGSAFFCGAVTGRGGGDVSGRQRAILLRSLSIWEGPQEELLLVIPDVLGFPSIVPSWPC